MRNDYADLAEDIRDRKMPDIIIEHDWIINLPNDCLVFFFNKISVPRSTRQRCNYKASDLAETEHVINFQSAWHSTSWPENLDSPAGSEKKKDPERVRDRCTTRWNVREQRCNQGFNTACFSCSRGPSLLNLDKSISIYYAFHLLEISEKIIRISNTR